MYTCTITSIYSDVIEKLMYPLNVFEYTCTVIIEYASHSIASGAKKYPDATILGYPVFFIKLSSFILFRIYCHGINTIYFLNIFLSTLSNNIAIDGDTTSGKDLVIKQYESLPYPHFGERLFLF